MGVSGLDSLNLEEEGKPIIPGDSGKGLAGRAGALLFGTDEPHVPDASRDVLAALRARPWPTSDLEAVLTGNAQRLGLS